MAGMVAILENAKMTDIAEPAPPIRWPFHRYAKYAFLEDLDHTRHIPVGRLWGTRIAVTPTAALQVPFFFALGVLLTFVPGRMALVAPIGDRIENAVLFTVAGLVANAAHAFGHIVSGTLAGSAMDELLMTATRDANLYHGDQGAVRGRTHIARAVGGPVGNLVVAAITFAVLTALGGWGTQPMLDRIAGVNLLFGLGGFLPLPSVDGAVIWREVWRGLRG